MPVRRRKLHSDIVPAGVSSIETPSLGGFPPPRLLRIPQVALYLNCSVWAVRDLVRRNELRKIRLGKKFLIDRADIDALIEKAKRGAA